MPVTKTRSKSGASECVMINVQDLETLIKNAVTQSVQPLINKIQNLDKNRSRS